MAIRTLVVIGSYYEGFEGPISLSLADADWAIKDALESAYESGDAQDAFYFVMEYFQANTWFEAMTYYQKKYFNSEYRPEKGWEDIVFPEVELEEDEDDDFE